MLRKLSKCFTLIELLIVVTILGVLSGIVLLIIQPSKHQQRAKDSVSYAIMEKLVLAAEIHKASTNEYPLCQDFLNTVTDSVYYDPAITNNLRCLDQADPNVTFAMRTIDLPSTCRAPSYISGQNGSDPCFFHYNGDWSWAGEPSSPHFYVRKWERNGNIDEYWCWNPLYSEGKILTSCDRTCGQMSADPDNPDCN